MPAMLQRLCAVLLLFPILGVAQTKKPSGRAMTNSEKLIAANVNGSDRFTADEVTAASGLKRGDRITENVLSTAAQRLADTGAFEEVSYSFVSDPYGTMVTWNVSDAPQFVPARFENLVWFTDQDLVAKLHEQLPLFKGELPLAGKMAASVQNGIEQLLIARGVKAAAACLPEAPLNQAIRSFVCRAQGVSVRVRNATFSGASGDFPKLLQAALVPITTDYVRSRIEFLLLPVYTQRGYLKAAIAAPETKIIEAKPDTTTIDLVVPVNEGKQYRLAGVSFRRNTAFGTAELEKVLRAPAGEPVNGIQLQHDLDRVHDLYGTRGYLEARLKPTPAYDDAQGTVSFSFDVTEGSPYRFRKVDIQFPNPEIASRLAAQWELRPGDAYDTSYFGRFMKKVVPTLPTTSRWKFTEQPKLDQKAKTVDVVLKIVPAS